MLTIWGERGSNSCDGISRRNFLRAGALGLSGLTLGNLMRLRASQPASGRLSQKAVIMVYLPGGPPHQDMYDLKSEAPDAIRGEFKPIRTNVPGMDICELLPLQAKIADQYSILRGLTFANANHQVEEIVSGFVPTANRPAFGSVVSRVRGTKAMPPYVSFGNLDLGSTINPENPHYLGSAHRPFTPGGPGLQNLGLHPNISLERMDDRRQLLHDLDKLDRTLDREDSMVSMDEFNARAFEILRSGRVKQAFDISGEPDRLREKYGPNTQMLLARRLVEAGVSVVTLSFTRSPGWDTHQKNFATMRMMLPQYDAAISTLLTDLRDRGLASDVAVVVWGEFGRSPVISSDGGRDHWPSVGCALLAGGGLKTGQVVGATDRQGGNPHGKAYNVQNVMATLYRVLGIDPGMCLTDLNGRPQTLLDDREVIEALL